jgi:hypothetical protein
MPAMNMDGLRLRFTILLFAALITLIAAALTQPIDRGLDPFSPYQWVVAAGAEELSCQDRPTFENWENSTITGQLCGLYPQTGPFNQIHVVRGEPSSPVYFTVRDGALTIGDLALLWGRPEVITMDWERMSLRWSDRGVTATVISWRRRFSYYLPVERVVFAAVSL